MPRKSKRSIHPSVKTALGYDVQEDDDTVLNDWEKRKRRVCKPCWELKYCPYGPLVEQAPLLPQEREAAAEHVEYLKECLRTNLVGEVELLDEESRKRYEAYLNDDHIILHQALYELTRRKELEAASHLPCEDDQIRTWIGDDELPPIHVYRAPFEIGAEKELDERQFTADVWKELQEIASQLRNKYEKGLRDGIIDHRCAIESPRKAFFKAQVKSFSPDKYPDSIPVTFAEAECNVFGHICPVFFAAEAFTETREPRRMGRRQISFRTMMRIVRRDDYRCQHCKKKLRDDEVEFDHIIPVSKGGSSEEHNLRLTCFECNRDKSDEYTP